jgi:tetratricopeptide (TPR) repeat protein
MHWENASQINQSIGNLEQEGILLQSMGVFYYDRTRYDSAIQSYIKAQNIFVSLGNEVRTGQVLWNLGEVFISICEYQKVFKTIYEARTLFERIRNYEELADVLFMLGKLYFKIELYNKLEEIFSEFNSNYPKLNVSDHYEILKEFFGQWVLFGKSGSGSIDKLKTISAKFFKEEDTKNFFESTFLLIKILINQGHYNEAIKEIDKPEIVNLCSQNSIFEAEREYFLGIISKNFTSISLLPPLVYFEKAYDLIKDQYISELTWKVLSEISEIYVERGNLNKAKHFVTYTRELIYLIAERIESPHLRAAYLRQKERLNTLKKMESFFPQK